MADQVQVESVPCNLCGADETSPWGYKDGIHIVRCQRCNLVYSNPRPTSEELAHYYTAQYFEEGNYATDDQRHRMYEIDIQHIVRRVGTKGRFLDVGCAYGAFLNALPDSFEKFGVEYSPDAAQKGRENYGLAIEVGQLHEVSFADDFFDVVHSRGVIEHTQDPFSDLLAAHRLLKEDGWLIVSTTPNIASPCARLYRERFRLVFPREHIYYFSPKTLTAMLQKAGFQPLHWVYPYRGTPYANPVRDVVGFALNRLLRKASPPFWKSVMTVRQHLFRCLCV